MSATTRLVQIIHLEHGRRVALVNGDQLHLLSTHRTTYDFALAALEIGSPMRDLISTDLSGIVLDYNEVHALRSGWRFLPSFDHPRDLARCMVSGCANGQMRAHEGKAEAPPWFYKGNGAQLRAHGEALTIPAFAHSGAEEAEIAGVWVIDRSGQPVLVGLTPGNEFADPALTQSDARMHSHAKMRTCSIGPELALDGDFSDVSGRVCVERGRRPIWASEALTGDRHTQFTLRDVERFHFQYQPHRVPGDVHIHFLGGSVSSYNEGIRLEDRDHVVIEWDGFGRPLRNLIERV